MILRVKNWARFQHYKHRRPPWIRLYRELLDDFEWHRLPLASRALAPMLWLLASETNSGQIEGASDALAFRLHIASKDFEEAIEPLISNGWFECEHDASTTLAPCEQHATSEYRVQSTDSEAKASGGKPPADPVKELWDEGVHLLTAHGSNERNARGKIGDWRKKFGDERTHAGIKAAREQAVSEPIGWITKWLKAPSNAAAPRTAEEALAQIEGWKGLA